MRREIVLSGIIIISTVIAFSTVACSNKGKNSLPVAELENSLVTDNKTDASSSGELTEENTTHFFTSAAIDSEVTNEVTTKEPASKDSNQTKDNSALDDKTVPETKPFETKENNISHKPTKATEVITQTTKEVTVIEDNTDRETKPTEKETEPVTKITEPATKATEPETKSTEPTKAVEPTTKYQEPSTIVPEPTTLAPIPVTEAPTEKPIEKPTEAPTEETTKEKSIYDYPFDLEAIRQEMISWGEAMGLEHCVYDAGHLITPDEYSWFLPVYGTKTFCGERLKKQLMEQVEIMPRVIEECGGGKITWFCIYVEQNEKGEAAFYYIY